MGILGRKCVVYHLLVACLLTTRVAGNNWKRGAADPTYTTSAWQKHYTSDGVDICDSDPLNEVCSCPCDSDLITITQKLGGGAQCLNGWIGSETTGYGIKDVNNDPGLSAKTCAAVGLIPTGEICGSTRVCQTSSGKCATAANDPDGQRCLALGARGATDYVAAGQFCSNRGMRLCTIAEVQNGVIESNPSCNLDSEYVWTSTGCSNCEGSATQNYVAYARPSKTPYGQPTCVSRASSTLQIPGGGARYIYPACCADRSDNSRVFTLKADDTERLSGETCAARNVEMAGWSDSSRLAFNAVGTGYKKAPKSSCNGLNAIPGIECRTMHGPFTRNTPQTSKTFKNLGTHQSVLITLRVWANDMWNSNSGPVTVRAGNNGNFQEYFSLDRTDNMECGNSWDTFINNNGAEGYMFEPGKPAWSEFGGGTCFKYVSFTLDHVDDEIQVTVSSQMSVSTLPSNYRTAGPGRSVNYEYWGFDLLQVWTSSEAAQPLTLGSYKWGSLETKLNDQNKDWDIAYKSGTTAGTFYNNVIRGSNTNVQKNIRTSGWSCSPTACGSVQDTLAVPIPGNVETTEPFKGRYKDNDKPISCSNVMSAGTHNHANGCFEIHGPFGGVTGPSPVNELTKTFHIPRNTRSSKIRVKVRLWAGDSWNAGENVYLKLNTDVDTDPSPKVVAYAENCLWGYDKSDADVQPASANRKNGWEKYFANERGIYNPYEEGCSTSGGTTTTKFDAGCCLFWGRPSRCTGWCESQTDPTERVTTCKYWTIPCYVDIDYSYRWVAKSDGTDSDRLVVKIGSSIDQGIDNEWWGFNDLEIYTQETSTPNSGCPGDNNCDAECIKWPGSFETAIGLGLCSSEEDCDNVYTRETAPKCQDNMVPGSKCVPAPRMIAPGTYRTQCKLCNRDFWCQRNNGSFPQFEFIDPTRSDTSDNMKNREVTRFKVTAYGSMGSDGVSAVGNNYATIAFNTQIMTGSKLLARGASGNWRCNDCFESGAAEFEESDIQTLTSSNKYQYFDPAISSSTNGKNSFTITPQPNFAWCISHVEVRVCARPGRASIDSIAGASASVDVNALSANQMQRVVITGSNLGPVINAVSYGPAGYGYSIPTSDCTGIRAPYNSITCSVRKGIGGPHKWVVRSNGVGASDVSTVVTAYETLGTPTLEPPSTTTLGEPVRLGGANLFLDLLALPTAQAGVEIQMEKSGQYAEVASIASGNSLTFVGPTLTTANAALAGHNVRMYLRIVDPELGVIGESKSAAAPLSYLPPVLDNQIIERSDDNVTLAINVLGANLGASKDVGTGFLCRKVGLVGSTCADEKLSIVAWGHSSISWRFTTVGGGSGWSAGDFPGNVTIQVGNMTHYRTSNTLNFIADPPTIINDTQILALTDLIFPTTGGGTFDVFVKNLNSLVQPNPVLSDVQVKVGNQIAQWTHDSTQCTSLGGCRLSVTMPEGQGRSLPLVVIQRGYKSNTVSIAGYEPPVLLNVTYSQQLLGDQITGEYLSLDRPGVPSSGPTVKATGSNFGVTGKARFEMCSTPIPGCTGGRLECCEGQWRDWGATTLSAHSKLSMNIPGGVGYDHLFRISVGGQQSNSVAIRYLAPRVTSVLNQSLPTSSSVAPSGSPGLISILGENFGIVGSDTAARYGAPTVRIGARICSVNGWSNTKIVCQLPAGEGKNLPVIVVSGGQSSDALKNNGIYSYARPSITSFAPRYGSTDGSTKIYVNGTNFGTRDAVVKLVFYRQGSNPPVEFKRDVSDHTHMKLNGVHMPEGQGGNLTFRVEVSGQESDPFTVSPLTGINASGYPHLVNLAQGELYLPPLLHSVVPNHGPTSGCAVWEDLSLWKSRYLLSGGGGRQCKKRLALTINGYSLGIDESEVLMKVGGIWKSISKAGASDVEAVPISHSHTKLVFNAPVGVGKNLEIKVKIGGKVSVNSLTFSFDPPNDLSIMPVPFSAQNTNEPLEILATNGFGEEKSEINVTIGSKVCLGATWNPVHSSSGRPYLSCIPQLDVAGSKSILLDVAGFSFSSAARSQLEFNRSLVFSVCMAGVTNISSGETKTYYGRPCMGNFSMHTKSFRSAPCVDAPSGKGELCEECPEGAFCFIPGTPWPANKEERYTYFDPVSKTGFWRLERRLDIDSLEDKREAERRIKPSRWNKDFKLDYPGLHQKDFVFDFVPCEPSTACVGGNKCSMPYRQYEELCLAFQASEGGASNCTRTSDCNGGVSEGEICSQSNLANCRKHSVCDMDQADTNGIGKCRCVPATRCGQCTKRAEYPDGKVVKGYFKLDGACEECPENVPLLIAGLLCGVMLGIWGTTWMNEKQINTSVISIAVDYFQVLAIFRNAKIPWPPILSSFYRFFAIFNFNIDIAAPECIAVEITYDWKFWGTQLMPLIAFVLCILAYLFQRFVGYNCCRQRYKMRPDWKQFISAYLILVYFLYLMVVRRALQVFTCNPIVPSSDGFLYSTFTSPECPYGLCRCYDPLNHDATKNFYQAKFRYPAFVCLLGYGAGFPLLVSFILFSNKKILKTDQILRSYELGDSLESSNKNIWAARVKYKQLYYFFKPGKVYWILWILYRKVSIAFIAVLFYSNPGFQLAFTILVLFSSYVLQVRSRPYMSPLEKAAIRKDHEKKVELNVEKRKDIDNLIKRKLELAHKREKQKGKKEKRSSVTHAIDPNARSRAFSKLTNSWSKKYNTGNLRQYLFDYNSVELFMLGSAIFVCATGIMFTSGNFQNRPDLQWQSDLIAFLVIFAVCFSMLYLLAALMGEIFSDGRNPCVNMLIALFSRTKDRLISDDENNYGQQESFTMELNMNPIHGGGERANEALKDEITQLESLRQADKQQNKMLVERLKMSKQASAAVASRGAKLQVKRPKGAKKEFSQMDANSDDNIYEL